MRFPRVVINVATLACVSFGCDSTVGLDPTLPSIRKAMVVGACPAPDSADLSRVNMSILLESDDGLSADPSFKLLEQKKTLEEVVRASSFSFELNADSIGTSNDSVIPGATATRAGTADSQTIQYSASSVTYTAPGYPPSADPASVSQNEKDAIDAKGKLIVFALDSSGSLLGSDDRPDTAVVNTFNDQAASDRGDNRTVFFKDMLDLFAPRDFVSLVKISTNGGNIVPCDDACMSPVHMCSTPTRDRSLVRCGLEALEKDESGTTPINQVLKDIYNRIILSSTDLNPVVVLFTDGAEDDSTIEALRGEDGAIELYANGYLNNALTAPVPVIVLHLDQRSIAAAAVEDGGFGFRAGRDARLMELACATGGDYIFLESAEEMTSGRLGSLSRIVRNRIRGTWRVTTETGLGELERADWYVSTTMRVTVANRQLSFAMERGDISDPSSDSRLWFSKSE